MAEENSAKSQNQEDSHPDFLTWKNDDNYLRKVETNTLIPKRMREKAKALCTEPEEAYVECCRNHKVLLFLKCRTENKAFNDCLIKQYEDPALRESCTAEYLADRKQFRDTGVPAVLGKRAKKFAEEEKKKKEANQQTL